MRLPSREERFPLVDDHLVVPEVTRDEIINGRRLEASPAERRHARYHSRLDYVISAHIAPGYEGGTDLLTRHGADSDFASDVAVLKEGTDPATGTRHLEELAFEVVSEQSRRSITEKAPIMLRRGVRRVFAIFLKDGAVEEWSKEKQKFVALPPGASLHDKCLVRPLKVAALLDAARAETEVGKALIAKKNEPVMAFWAEGHAEGKAEGTAESILKILEGRHLKVNSVLRQQILSCRDLPTLERWLTRSLTASSSAEVVSE